MQMIPEFEGISLDSSHESECPPTNIMPMEYVKETTAYQTKAENINVLQANANKEDNIFESHNNVDHVLSGESLYKTFTFEQSSDEELEKCIAFWKSVMQKNLEPIKCSIIESSKTEVPNECEKKASVDIAEEARKIAENSEQKIHDYYRNLWGVALKQLQKKKLHEVKLVGKTRCKMCESQISLGENVEIDQKEILELNEWKPESKQLNAASKLPKDETDGDAEEDSPKPVCVCKAQTQELQESISIDTVISDGMHVPPNTERYRLIDLIGEKKRTGAYSRWRRNVAEPCGCEVETCDCNLNPAIISTKLSDDTCGCGQLQCQCKIKEELAQSDKGDKADDKEKAAEKESVKRCECGFENCTCNSQSISSPDTSSESSFTQVSDAPTETVSVHSKETVEARVGKVEPLQDKDLYRAGPLKRSSKADVTQYDESNNSRTTLGTNEIEAALAECACMAECESCGLEKASKITENSK